MHEQSQQLFGLLRTVTQLAELERMGAVAGVAPPHHALETLSHPEVEESCTVQHPGAVCCTQWKVRSLPASQTVTVKMQTKCERQGGVLSAGLEMEGYVALALRVRVLCAWHDPGWAEN